MDPTLASAATDRRTLLRLLSLGAAAAAGGGLLSACSGEVSSDGAATNVDKLAGLMPTQQDLPPGIPKPDVAGVRPMPDGFTQYPAELVDAITEKPGTSGKTIKAITPAWGDAPPGLGNSEYLDAVNAELGIQLDFSVQDGNTYSEKVNALLGARDVPDLLCVPEWELEKLPRFADAAKALFEDLTDYLKGDAVSAYPMLATFPTSTWRKSVWNERLMAVPNPTDGPFPFVMFYRKDLLDAAGLTYPTSMEELLALGKQLTNPTKGVWAFDDIFPMIQMYYKVPGSDTGWRRKPDGTPEHKYETPEFRQAVETMAKIYSDGLVHPDLVASRGADSKQLLESGKIFFKKDGMGMWQTMQAEQQKVLKTFNIQPMPVFSASGGDPLVWGDWKPTSFTFIKKGLGKERVEELLRVINWCSAPFGTREFNLREYGVEGKHHTRSAIGPVKTDLGFKQIANQYYFISGRIPLISPWPETPKYVPEMLAYSNAMVKHIEKSPWEDIQLEFPAKYKGATTPTEDKITDILRGRRPLSDLDAVVTEWRGNGGDEARDLLAKALADAGR